MEIAYETTGVSQNLGRVLNKFPGLTNLTLETLLALIPMHHLHVDIVLPIVSSESL